MTPFEEAERCLYGNMVRDRSAGNAENTFESFRAGRAAHHLHLSSKGADLPGLM
jgi:hypothetical protein